MDKEKVTKQIAKVIVEASENGNGCGWIHEPGNSLDKLSGSLEINKEEIYDAIIRMKEENEELERHSSVYDDMESIARLSIGTVLVCGILLVACVKYILSWFFSMN
ncbi:hypothetical protein BK703_30780 [Bacillus thuringiensis serovar silo]|uniref:hypothetical protein n=1 Tax=Bacillus thuringiensis TaxID=1428 RepID=UPI000A3A7610|nr:hypothetical protein [Bacillus thuringiensis]OTW47666.1 hypothetical protein BK703_30780 [Bacillus thuringiensis serovar silo]OTW66797.1 hypothetical protein BK700_09490 [Bacillus thuringiensis serovar toguchini]